MLTNSKQPDDHEHDLACYMLQYKSKAVLCFAWTSDITWFASTRLTQLSAQKQQASPQAVISPPDRQKHCREASAVDRQKHCRKGFAVVVQKHCREGLAVDRQKHSIAGRSMLLTKGISLSGRACVWHSIPPLSFAAKDAANRCSKPSRVPLLSIVA